jgi:DNA-binding CsgD family transcriptional regulator
MCLESSGKPDAGKLARPVWGWGQGVIPWPTPRAGPAEVACLRIDFADWLALQPKRSRQIAESLAVGHTPREVARRFSISQARISQLRRALRESWNAFQGEKPAAAIA